MVTKMKEKKTPMQAMQELRESVESMNSAKTERIGSPSLGDVVRQGDVYLVCIEKLPAGKETKNHQLAPGTTQGSRHVLSDVVPFGTDQMSGCGWGEGRVKIVTDVADFKAIPKALIGPAFECVGDVTVAHPEHGDKILPAGTCWQVVYQQAFAEEIRRVND